MRAVARLLGSTAEVAVAAVHVLSRPRPASRRTRRSIRTVRADVRHRRGSDRRTAVRPLCATRGVPRRRRRTARRACTASCRGIHGNALRMLNHCGSRRCPTRFRAKTGHGRRSEFGLLAWSMKYFAKAPSSWAYQHTDGQRRLAPAVVTGGAAHHPPVARTGQPRVTATLCLRDGDRMVLPASFGGRRPRSGLVSQHPGRIRAVQGCEHGPHEGEMTARDATAEGETATGRQFDSDVPALPPSTGRPPTVSSRW